MDPRHYQVHDALEARHWWFVGRARIVLSVLRRALSTADGTRRLLDLGCGTGGMLVHLRELGEAAGVEMAAEAREIARRKSGVEVRPGSLPHDIPFERGSWTAVTMLDVVEHVQDDVASFAACFDLLQPGGFLLCTVPAHQFLWSEHDVINEHKRRYSKRELRDKLHNAGFRIRLLSYYNMFFFPPVALLRLLRNRQSSEGTLGLGIVPAPLNDLMTEILASERHLLRLIRLPVGVSLIALAQKS